MSTAPRCRAVALLPALALIALAAPPASAQSPAAAADANTIVIERTLEASPGYPRIHAQLRRNGQVVTGDPGAASLLQGVTDLNDLMGLLDGGAANQPQQRDTSFMAFLDTGASAYLLSTSTAGRFAVEAVPDAVYHEVGLHGETPMGVSAPYTLAIAGSSGMLDDQPGEWIVVDQEAVIQLSQTQHDAMVEMTMGEINVVGMPAIKQFVVEIDPAPMAAALALFEPDAQGQANLEIDNLLNKLGEVGVGPAIRLHQPGIAPAGVEAVIPLDYRNFSRRKNPNDKGPLPDLHANPVIVGIQTQQDGKTFRGDWLLDTGAPASIISTAHAQALGLYDQAGNPTRASDFSLPLGGVEGQARDIPGFRIDRLVVPAADGKRIEYRDIHVVVTDVSTQLDDGSTVTLDGVFGTNFLFPTMSGVASGLPTDIAPPPYRRIWIDGPGKRLLLDVSDEAAP